MATAKTTTDEDTPVRRGAASTDESGNVVDPADNATRAPKAKLNGKRVRGIPAVITNSGDRANVIEIRPRDITNAGGPQLSKTLRFDARRDDFTLAVGDGDRDIPEDVAEWLTKERPASFEYVK